MADEIEPTASPAPSYFVPVGPVRVSSNALILVGLLLAIATLAVAVAWWAGTLATAASLIWAGVTLERARRVALAAPSLVGGARRIA
jgi:hypothetical protein